MVSGHFHSGQKPTRKIITLADAHLGQLPLRKGRIRTVRPAPVSLAQRLLFPCNGEAPADTAWRAVRDEEIHNVSRLKHPERLKWRSVPSAEIRRWKRPKKGIFPHPGMSSALCWDGPGWVQTRMGSDAQVLLDFSCYDF